MGRREINAEIFQDTIEYAVFHTARETQNYEAFLRRFGKE